jgi:ribonuclease HI
MGYFIYTDGSARGNPGPGGAACLIDWAGQRTEISRGFRHTTNNRMELLAIIMALETAPATAEVVTLVSDSKYALDALSKRWIAGWVRRDWKTAQGAPVKNRDLWERLAPLVASRRMSYRWVKGHSSTPENNRCDFLAVCAATTGGLLIDGPYEASLPSSQKALT